MKEILLRRLIGAGVLLVLAFGMASFLPSPEPGARLTEAQQGERRVVTYELGGGRPVGLQMDAELETPKDASKRRRARPASQARTAQPPVGGVGSAETLEPATEPTVKPNPVANAVPKPQPKPDPKPDSKPGPEFDPGATRWSVQVASFADPGNARKTRDRLKAKKLPAHVQEVHVGNAVWFRVRVGPYAKESGARKAMEQVKRLDFRGARLVEE